MYIFASKIFQKVKFMIVERKEFKETDGSVGYIESVYQSGNILKTTYFPTMNRLYISFSRGGTYSYEHITPEIYNEFENADSQGTYLSSKIKNNKDFPFRKEFTLYPEELKSVKMIVEEFKKNKENE